ncbi:MAG: alpha/beta hydrolase [Cyclobacteriaceae bacterium]
MKYLFLFTLLWFSFLTAKSQNAPLVVPLWEQGAPGFEDRKDKPEEAKEYWVRQVHNPSITVFEAENPNGAAVLIFPGGGHRLLVFDEEGTKTAKYLNTLGVTGIVLKYRLFREENSPYTLEHAKEDAVRAMRQIRAHAGDWHIDQDRIGIMGFSAGGEVVNMVAFEDFPGDANASDAVEQQPAHANFQIQIYPGPLGIPEKVASNAIPAFLLASNNDACCSETIVKLLEAYRAAKAPVEAHFYEKGDHGFNMGDRSEYKTISHWPGRLADWLEDNHFFAHEIQQTRK